MYTRFIYVQRRRRKLLPARRYETGFVVLVNYALLGDLCGYIPFGRYLAGGRALLMQDAYMHPFLYYGVEWNNYYSEGKEEDFGALLCKGRVITAVKSYNEVEEITNEWDGELYKYRISRKPDDVYSANIVRDTAVLLHQKGTIAPNEVAKIFFTSTIRENFWWRCKVRNDRHLAFTVLYKCI
ncbi:MAG: hypothetical protein KatS3mg083_140 [Candidatus Dojkabacteria bacterium]|nr:MAG: hypothetical protein KatS3mg083_140 [Candidatus Dojkabacteria bacterium]